MAYFVVDSRAESMVGYLVCLWVDRMGRKKAVKWGLWMVSSKVVKLAGHLVVGMVFAKAG